MQTLTLHDTNSKNFLRWILTLQQGCMELGERIEKIQEIIEKWWKSRGFITRALLSFFTLLFASSVIHYLVTGSVPFWILWVVDQGSMVLIKISQLLSNIYQPLMLLLHIVIIILLVKIVRMTPRAEKSGIASGIVYPDCKWIKIVDEREVNGKMYFYVTCTHPNRPMTSEGCPSGCYGFEPPPPSGVGAILGFLLGGSLGLAGGILGGLVGGILGGLLGHGVESATVQTELRMKINSCKVKGQPYFIIVTSER